MFSLSSLAGAVKLLRPVLPWLIGAGLILSAGIWLGKIYGAYTRQKDVDAAVQAADKVQSQFDAFKTLTAEKDAARAADDAEKARQNALQAAKQVVLLEKYRQQAEQADAALLAREKELTAVKQKLEKSIEKVTRSDGAVWTGIGPQSLCVYRQNLGYPAGPECEQRLSATNPTDAGHSTQTGSAGAGLSPSGLLNHAGEYGEWCGKLESKLRAIGQMYGKDAQ